MRTYSATLNLGLGIMFRYTNQELMPRPGLHVSLFLRFGHLAQALIACIDWDLVAVVSKQNSLRVRVRSLIVL